ncbi:MarR family winged helix-turn-helix transcriptional regulator [Paractinoplanes ferrugineus]|uniref:MarR family transcriptional regulator n=1 Tax=Paractinoplanes ferrugineus TaxID=113564 RepID=A0A919J262_9ACTN|nr:hypothetical protein [Actinoplanes ferrugineus]GIE11563.1 hypothetical protein Afe05nite_34030 [Actinoplanes ferrugineus]
MNTTTGEGRPRPIGYVLRKLDLLIEERFERTLGERGISRRQWQILNTLADGGSTLAKLADGLAPFLDPAAGETVQPHIEPLKRPGFVHQDGDSVTLTGTGRDLLGTLTTDVAAIRELATTGIDQREYDRTVTNLQVMIRNLEDARQADG